jgi:hypothetical protein
MELVIKQALYIGNDVAQICIGILRKSIYSLRQRPLNPASKNVFRPEFMSAFAPSIRLAAYYGMFARFLIVKLLVLAYICVSSGIVVYLETYNQNYLKRHYLRI